MSHLDDATLARLRGDDERDEDAEAFRHLASCAVCRARLIEHPVEVRALSAPPARVIPISEKRVSGRSVVLVGGVLSVAAVILIMVLALRRSTPEIAPLALRTKSYAGTMGSTPAPPTSVPPRDLNYELAFDAPASAAARLVVIDRMGRSLAPMRAFERNGRELRVVIAPRMFAAHEGEAQAIVVSGEGPATTAAASEIEAALAKGPLAREEIAAIALRYSLAIASVMLP